MALDLDSQLRDIQHSVRKRELHRLELEKEIGTRAKKREKRYIAMRNEMRTLKREFLREEAEYKQRGASLIRRNEELRKEAEELRRKTIKLQERKNMFVLEHSLGELVKYRVDDELKIPVTIYKDFATQTDDDHVTNYMQAISMQRPALHSSFVMDNSTQLMQTFNEQNLPLASAYHYSEDTSKIAQNQKQQHELEIDTIQSLNRSFVQLNSDKFDMSLKSDSLSMPLKIDNTNIPLRFGKPSMSLKVDNLSDDGKRTDVDDSHKQPDVKEDNTSTNNFQNDKVEIEENKLIENDEYLNQLSLNKETESSKVTIQIFTGENKNNVKDDVGNNDEKILKTEIIDNEVNVAGKDSGQSKDTITLSKDKLEGKSDAVDNRKIARPKLKLLSFTPSKKTNEVTYSKLSESTNNKNDTNSVNVDVKIVEKSNNAEEKKEKSLSIGENKGGNNGERITKTFENSDASLDNPKNASLDGLSNKNASSNPDASPVKGENEGAQKNSIDEKIESKSVKVKPPIPVRKSSLKSSSSEEMETESLAKTSPPVSADRQKPPLKPKADSSTSNLTTKSVGQNSKVNVNSNVTKESIPEKSKVQQDQVEKNKSKSLDKEDALKNKLTDKIKDDKDIKSKPKPVHKMDVDDFFDTSITPTANLAYQRLLGVVSPSEQTKSDETEQKVEDEEQDSESLDSVEEAIRMSIKNKNQAESVIKQDTKQDENPTGSNRDKSETNQPLTVTKLSKPASVTQKPVKLNLDSDSESFNISAGAETDDDSDFFG